MKRRPKFKPKTQASESQDTMEYISKWDTERKAWAVDHLSPFMGWNTVSASLQTSEPARTSWETKCNLHLPVKSSNAPSDV